MIGLYLDLLKRWYEGDPKVDQKTANQIALIKVLAPAIMAVMLAASIVLLAFFRDGAYENIISSQAMPIVIACLATLGVLRITDVAGSILQTKYTGAPNTVPPSGPEVSSPPLNSTNGVAHAPATPAPAPAPAAVPAPADYPPAGATAS